jgi:hypothetical protein
VNDSFGLAFEQLLEDSGRQKQEVAALLGKDRAHISRYCRNDASPDFHELWDILRFCGANSVQTTRVSQAWVRTLLHREVGKKLPRPDDGSLALDREAQALACQLWQLIDAQEAVDTPVQVTNDTLVESSEQQYEQWIRRSQQLSGIRQRARAFEALEIAAKVARDDPKALALVRAYQAICRSEMDDLTGAEKQVNAALALLTLDIRRLELNISARNIDEQFATGDPTERLAFALTVKAWSYIRYTQERLGEAEASSQLFLAATRALGDRNLQAEAKHILGKTLVAKGAGLGTSHETEFAWRAIRNRDEIKRGLGYLRQAQVTRSEKDHVGRLRDLHQEGKALLILGDVAGANRVGDIARDLCGESWRPIELPLDEARRELAQGAFARAQSHLLEVLDLGWSTRAIELQARALIGLAELELERPRSRRQALDYCVAAMLAWPFALNQRDFQRAVRVFRRLDAKAFEFEQAYASGRFPVDTVSGLPHLNMGRVFAIMNHLADAVKAA